MAIWTEVQKRAAISTVLTISIVVVIAVAAVVGVYYVTTMNTPQTGKPFSAALSIGAADVSDVPELRALSVYMSQFGYTASTTIMADEPDAIAALLSGQVNVVALNVFSPELLTSKGQDIVVFGVMQAAPDENMVCGGNITTMQQIVSQHASVGYGSKTDITYMLPGTWLVDHKYNISAFNWVSIHGAANRGHALLSGKITCASVDVSSTLILLSQPNNAFHIVASLGSMAPGVPLNVWTTTKSYFDSHQDALAALMKSMLLAVRWAQNKPDYMSYAPSILGTEVSQQIMSQSYDQEIQLGIWTPNLPWNSTIASKAAHISANFGLTPSYIDPSQWTDFTLYQQAITAEGAVKG